MAQTFQIAQQNREPRIVSHLPTSLILLLHSLTIRLIAQLRINRADLAQKTLTQMQKLDDENCLTGLASVWLSLYKSGTPA